MIDRDFLDAIAADPEDDVPRLIYADWLEEQGNPRGEFIRLQCQLAEMQCEDDGFEELDGRMRDLLLEHEGEWTGPIREIVNQWRFHRGLLDYAEIEAEQFLKHAETLFNHDLFSFLTFKRSTSFTEQLANCAPLTRLLGLCLDQNETGWGGMLDQFFTSPYLLNLRRLSVASNRLRDDGTEALANCNMPKLEFLDLSYNGIRNDGIIALTNSGNLNNLKALFLSSNEIRTKGAKALAMCERLNNLEMLHIEGNPLPDAGVTYLQERFRKPCALYL